jgi:hypothetical protein
MFGLIYDIIIAYTVYAVIMWILTPPDWRPVSFLGKVLRFFDFVGNFVRWYKTSKLKQDVFKFLKSSDK